MRLVAKHAPKAVWMPAERPASAQVMPRERRTQLFSATMTSKVAKLQRACLENPVKVEVDVKYRTVDTLRQQYLFIPAKHKVGCLALPRLCTQWLAQQSGDSCIPPKPGWPSDTMRLPVSTQSQDAGRVWGMAFGSALVSLLA